MAARKEILDIGGREVAISNPDKVYFPRAGHTKLDLVRYFLAVADGALVGVRGRPMALKRFVDGAEKEPFFQKRAPDNRPDWMRVATLTFPSGRTADELVVRRGGRASPGSPTSAAWTSTRIPSAPRTWTIPTSCASTSIPCPGVPWSDVREVALVCREALEARGARRLAEDVRLPRHPHQRAHRAALDVPGGPAGRARAGPGRGAAGALDRHRRSGGRRSATASSSTTTRTRRTGPSRPPTRSAPRRTPGCRSRCAGTRCRTA